jgi:hypothetical protein
MRRYPAEFRWSTSTRWLAPARIIANQEAIVTCASVSATSGKTHDRREIRMRGSIKTCHGHGFESPLHPLSAPFNRRSPVEVAKESAMPWHFCHMHAPHKKLRLPEWYVLAWMMERALNAVVRDGKTIYIGRHMPPSSGT